MGTSDRADDVKKQEKGTGRKKEKLTTDKVKVAENKKKTNTKKARQRAQKAEGRKNQQQEKKPVNWMSTARPSTERTVSGRTQVRIRRGRWWMRPAICWKALKTGRNRWRSPGKTRLILRPLRAV